MRLKSVAPGCTFWVTVGDMPPYPYCQSFTVSDCVTKRYARNNYAMAAANYWLESELRKIKYPNLQLVNSFKITLPRLDYGEYIFKNHYLGGWQTGAPAGFVVADAVKRAICRAANVEDFSFKISRS